VTTIETEARIHRAADLLLAARRDRRPVPGFPEDGRPHTIEEAWSIQDRVVEALGGRGGWKVGAANATSEPGVAPLPASGMHTGTTRLVAAGFNFVGIEAEIAFRFGRDLPRRDADYTTAEVLSAVESVHPAIEVVDARLTDWRSRPAIEQAADLGNHGAFVLGPANPAARADIDQTRVTARVLVDRNLRVERTGGNTAVDVQRLLTWLANHCARRGTPIRAGDVVTSGSCTGLEIVGAPCSVTAELDGLGKVGLILEA
jgi:2-keto-4-pentenoate hydratase